MGTRETEQSPLWIAASDLPTSPGHPFYARLNALLGRARLRPIRRKTSVASSTRTVMGRPSLPPGQYFRLLLVGYFEGIDCGARHRVACRRLVGRPQFRAAGARRGGARSLDDFADAALDRPRDAPRRLHVGAAAARRGRAAQGTRRSRSTRPRSKPTRRCAASCGATPAESYQEFLTRLAKASGIETPTREDLARLDRKRKKKTSNKDWTNPLRSRCEGHEDEGRPDASGPQSRACRRPGDRRDCRGHAAGRGRRRHDDDRRDGDGRGRAGRRRAGRCRRAAGAGRDHRATRAITAIRRWWTSTPWAFGPTSRSRTGVDAIGRRSRRPRRRCMAIVGGFAAPRGRRLMRRRGETDRTLVRACLRHRRHAPHASARSHEHPEAVC